MLKKTVKYTDFDGNEQSEDLYFNLTRAELIDTEIGESGAFRKKLESISTTSSGAEIIATFKEVLRRAYGVRSEDGKRFMKSPALYEEFSQTAVYDELFLTLVTDAAFAVEFITAVTPKNISAITEANTVAEAARAASEANLQGFKKRLDHEASGIVDVPELPTVAPNLEQQSKSLEAMTPDELRTRLAELVANKS